MRRKRGGNVAKWLALCFPYGLFLMWRKQCRWHPVAKVMISAVFLAAVVAVMIMPAPEQSSGTVIKLAGNEPKAEIFGPDAPAHYNASDFMPGDTGEDLFATAVEDNTIYVYASGTEGSTYYHSPVCKYAYASSRRMTLYEAYVLGYRTPCGLCNPPIYSPGE